MSEPYYWWYVYGRFGPGVDNLPCIGEVIAYYLALSGLSKEELAHNLNWSVRYIEMLKSRRNKDMPQLLPRRILLAKALHIPPVLLGLSSVTLFEWSDGTTLWNGEAEQETLASSETMTFYERLLAVSWELYYTSSVQKAAESVDQAFARLNSEFAHASGIKKDQCDAMRCRFYQLSSLIARDRMEADEAIACQNQAVSIAMRLKNAELIASSLLRRARAYLQVPDYDRALEDALQALPYADLSRDPLKGKCYQMAGEAQAYLAGERRDLQAKSLNYFDKAAWIARKGNLEPDGSFVKTDLTSVYIERAKALTLFRRFDEAHDALELARKHLSPELTRWQVNLQIEEARTYFAEKDITSCCYCLLDALPLVRALNLPRKEQYISKLYEKCKTIAPTDKVVKELGKQLALATVRP